MPAGDAGVGERVVACGSSVMYTGKGHTMSKIIQRREKGWVITFLFHRKCHRREAQAREKRRRLHKGGDL